MRAQKRGWRVSVSCHVLRRRWRIVYLRRTQDHGRALPGEPGVSALGFERKSHSSSRRWLIPPAVRLVVVVVVDTSVALRGAGHPLVV